MEDNQPHFTKEEISYIERSLNFIIVEWAQSLIRNVLDKALEFGVQNVYMNTPETLHGGATEGKVDYIYERLPVKMGFKKTRANLRGSLETFWLYNFDEASKTAKSIDAFIKQAQENIQPQEDKLISADLLSDKWWFGAVISRLGKKPVYKASELRVVCDMLKKENDKRPKAQGKFFYGWNKEWNGGQAFFENTSRSNKADTVVTQKLHSEVQDRMMQDPILAKFFSFILGTGKHFDQDTLGFALVNKIDDENWVINEVQTDCINHYMKERNKLRPDKEVSKTKGATWNTVKDMLEANNRRNWIAKLDTMPELKQQILENPNLVNDLCDDSHDIEKWMEERRGQEGAVMGRGLNIAFDLSRRIFLLG